LFQPRINKYNDPEVYLRSNLHAAIFEVYDAIPALREVDEGDYSPGETIKRALLLCLRHGCSLIGVESNAYQATLAYWINIIFNNMELEALNC